MTIQQRVTRLDDALADGRLTEREWYQEVQALIDAAYLAEQTPERQSGLGGDAAHWARRRGIITEALERDGTLLDVGCANGLLMETLVAWASSRGLNIEPYGLDISPKLVALARSRLPAWGDRFFIGNVIDWDPPMRFDYVRTELDYVPPTRQADLVNRLLERVVAPDGRLIVCAYRARGATDADSVGDRLRSWGCAVCDEAVARDEASGGVATRVVWIDARC